MIEHVRINLQNFWHYIAALQCILIIILIQQLSQISQNYKQLIILILQTESVNYSYEWLLLTQAVTKAIYLQCSTCRNYSQPGAIYRRPRVWRKTFDDVASCQLLIQLYRSVELAQLRCCYPYHARRWRKILQDTKHGFPNSGQSTEGRRWG